MNVDLNILRAYEPLYKTRKPIISLKGSAASGKSWACAQRVVLWALDGKERILVVRKVHATLKESCYQDLLAVIESMGLVEGVHYEKRVSPLLIRFLQTDSEIVFRGLDNPEKIKSISGITKTWIEEVTELNASDFNQLRLRQRKQNDTPLQTLMSFNPVSRASWIYKDFYKNPTQTTRDQTLFVHTTYKDNPYNSDDFRRELERLKTIDENYYNVYALGNWGGLVTQIYPEIRPFLKPDFGKADEVFYGVDFGFNNPSAVIKCTLSDQRILVKEILYKSGLTTGDIISAIQADGEDRAEVYCDSAEPDRIKEMKNAGLIAYPVTKNNKQNSVGAGISLLKKHSDKIFVDPSSDNVLAELAKYNWKTDPKTNEILDEPVKANDHAMDAMRYAIVTYALKYHLWAD